MLRCPRCDQLNDDSSRFCKHCGSAIAVGSSEGGGPDDDTLIIRLLDERPEEALDRRARLWVLDPSGEHVAEVTDLLGDMTVIGRQPDSTVSLPSSTVSRRHAQIRRDGRQYFVSDLNSTNGTLLNREPVIGEELLHDRDEIGVGIYRLIFRYL
jgi:FHA domain/zinc-ribbon domain